MYPLLRCSILNVTWGIKHGYHYFRAGRNSKAPEEIHALITTVVGLCAAIRLTGKQQEKDFSKNGR